MRNVFLFFLAAFIFISCNSKKDSKKEPGKVTKGEYTITKDGIGDLKIGMKHTEVEKLLNQTFKFQTDKDAPNYWQDTVEVKYKTLPVTIIFQRQYDEEDSSFWNLASVSTKSSLCRTETGLGIGDEKSAIIPLYDDSPITLTPDYVQVNDSTWELSKSKYTVYIRDDKYDKELIFRLDNKKVSALEAGIIMGE